LAVAAGFTITAETPKQLNSIPSGFFDNHFLDAAGCGFANMFMILQWHFG
jgi:hypothetical protein